MSILAIKRYDFYLMFKISILLCILVVSSNFAYAKTYVAQDSERDYLINQSLDREDHQINYHRSKLNSKISSPKSNPSNLSPKELIKKNMTLKWDKSEEKKTSFPAFPTFKKREKEDKRYWEKYSFKFNTSVGQRIDKLRWDIAGNIDGTSPNVLSDLTWSDLKMKQVKASAQIAYEKHYVLDAMFASSDIYEGDTQDSDYALDNRRAEWSRSNNQSDDGEAVDYSIGLGYRLNLEKSEYFPLEETQVTLLAGYSHHEQHLIATDGLQTIATPGTTPPLGPFEGLDSRYETEWKGPWVGVELTGAIKKISGLFRFEFHRADYYAVADWNLRSDFEHPKSFDHTAEGNGLVFNLGIDYQLTNNFTVDFKADIQNWHTDHGIDTVYFSNGTRTKTRLNRVDWRSYALMFGSTYHFN